MEHGGVINMKLNIQSELDPVFETMGLLYVSLRGDKYKRDMITELGEFGMDGEAFYNKHLKLVDKYIHSFAKGRQWDERAEFFFNDEDDVFFHLLHSILSENARWMAAPEKIKGDDARLEILKMLASDEDIQKDLPKELSPENIKTLDQIVAFLDKCPFEVGVKWKLMAVLQHPRRYIQQLVAVVHSNLPAFEQAKQDVQKPLDKLIHKYTESVQKQQDDQFFKLVGMFTDEPVLHPSLIMPLAQVVFMKRCYYGLLVDFLTITRKTDTASPDMLLIKLKAMGDNSKLQILASLKVSPKYNLEIAEQLGLTAATMSHHMNVLLACGLVTVEKKNGKVYYHLDQDNIKQFLHELEQFLL